MLRRRQEDNVGAGDVVVVFITVVNDSLRDRNHILKTSTVLLPSLSELLSFVLLYVPQPKWLLFLPHHVSQIFHCDCWNRESSVWNLTKSLTFKLSFKNHDNTDQILKGNMSFIKKKKKKKNPRLVRNLCILWRFESLFLTNLKMPGLMF